MTFIPTPEPQVTAQTLEEFIGRVNVASGRVPPPGLLFCAESHPLDPIHLCVRLDGHSGVHQSDGGDAWLDRPDSRENP